jgi:hypothetical protein
MKKWISLIPILLFFGCAEVQSIATRVVTDPNVIAAAKVAGTAAIKTATYGNPEIAAVVTAGTAMLVAIGALVKSFDKEEKE